GRLVGGACGEGRLEGPPQIPSAGPPFPSWGAYGNSSASACNFACDRWDCSDESHCSWYMSTSEQRAKLPAAPTRLHSPTLSDAASTCELRAWYSMAETDY
ncbi:Hypothetical predicted protein, partial [Podarcis lilfordi]